jgi:putative membrane protein
VLGQAFGDDGLLVATFSPGFADDIEYGVGLSAIAEARSAGLSDVLLVDAHNCNNGLGGEDLGHVTPGSRRSFDMFEAARSAAEAIASAPQEECELGTAWDPTPWGPADGIGPLGIRVAVVRAGGGATGYVLIDGSNMGPGLRKRIVETVEAGRPHDLSDAELRAFAHLCGGDCDRAPREALRAVVDETDGESDDERRCVMI